MNNEGISLIDTKKGIPRLNFRFDKDYPEDFLKIGSGDFIKKRTGDIDVIYLAHKFMSEADVINQLSNYINQTDINANPTINAKIAQNPDLFFTYKKEIRKAIKNLSNTDYISFTGKDIQSVKSLIQRGILDFNNRINNIKDYDLIITVPSQAPLNQMIINEFKSYIDTKKTLVIDDFLLKNRIKDIRWDNNEYLEVEEREGKNPEQIVKVRKMRDIMLKSIYSKGNLNKDFQVKMVTKPSLRRYFNKFMHINDVLDEQLFLKINNGKILIIDDSFGSGVTMREAARSIKHLNPKTVDAFILLHDYAPSAKKTSWLLEKVDVGYIHD